MRIVGARVVVVFLRLWLGLGLVGVAVIREDDETPDDQPSGWFLRPWNWVWSPHDCQGIFRNADLNEEKNHQQIYQL